MATKTVATCTAVSVSVPDQRLGGPTEVLGMFATRTVVAGGQTASEKVIDERRLERQPSGQWLVGGRVEGG